MNRKSVSSKLSREQVRVELIWIWDALDELHISVTYSANEKKFLWKNEWHAQLLAITQRLGRLLDSIEQHDKRVGPDTLHGAARAAHELLTYAITYGTEGDWAGLVNAVASASFWLATAIKRSVYFDR